MASGSHAAPERLNDVESAINHFGWTQIASKYLSFVGHMVPGSKALIIYAGTNANSKAGMFLAVCSSGGNIDIGNLTTEIDHSDITINANQPNANAGEFTVTRTAGSIQVCCISLGPYDLPTITYE